jgi:hypothetical protein
MDDYQAFKAITQKITFGLEIQKQNHRKNRNVLLGGMVILNIMAIFICRMSIVSRKLAWYNNPVCHTWFVALCSFLLSFEEENQSRRFGIIRTHWSVFDLIRIRFHKRFLSKPFGVICCQEPGWEFPGLNRDDGFFSLCLEEFLSFDHDAFVFLYSAWMDYHYDNLDGKVLRSFKKFSR